MVSGSTCPFVSYPRDVYRDDVVSPEVITIHIGIYQKPIKSIGRLHRIETVVV
jgi:hypothetical protein